MSGQEAAVVEKRKAEAEKLAEKKEKAAPAEPAATPVAKKEKPPTEKIAKAEAIQPPAEHAARGPDSYHKEAVEKKPAVAEKKTEPLSAEEELKRTEPSLNSSPTDRTFLEPTPLPKSEVATKKTESVPLPTTEPLEPAREVKESPPAETPTVLHQPMTEQTPEITEQKPEISRDSSGPPTAKETPADVSVNALVGPPSSLRTNSIPEGSLSENKETESAPPKSEGPLAERDVINLADREARQEGCPLDDYERPKVDHSAVKGKWTLFYARKSDASGNLPAMFSATVEDKTRKVEIRK